MQVLGLIIILVCTNIMFMDRYNVEAGIRIILLNLIGTALTANVLVKDFKLWQLYGLFFLVFVMFSWIFFTGVRRLLTA